MSKGTDLDEHDTTQRRASSRISGASATGRRATLSWTCQFLSFQSDHMRESNPLRRSLVSHPILQAKPNASHVCARINLHTHDRQNECNTIAVINRSRVKPVRYPLLHPERWTRRSEHNENKATSSSISDFHRHDDWGICMP
jgi:hypothetical protein